MERPLFYAAFLLVVWVELCRAQNCPDIGGVVAGSIFGTLAFVGLIIAIVALILWIRRNKGNKRKANKQKKTGGGDGAYDNPNFQLEETDGRPATTRTVDHAEQGFGGYMECKEYESPKKDDQNGKKSEPNNGDLAQKTSEQEARPNGNGPCLPRNLFISGSSGSLNDNKSSPDPEVMTVEFQSQDIIGLGFNVAGNMREGIYISQIHNRGPASESGQVKLGDRILSITVSCENMVYEDALHILSYASPYPVKLRIRRTAPQDAMQKPSKEPHLNLLHPLYRSSSMDDLSKIGKDNQAASRQIACENAQQNAIFVDVSQDIETDKIKLSPRLQIPHMEADTSDLIDGNVRPAGGSVSLENLHSSGAEVMEVDIPGDVSIGARSTSLMEISTPKPERDESIPRKSISDSDINSSDMLPPIPKGSPPPLRQWSNNTQLEDSVLLDEENDSFVQVRAPEMSEPYSGLTEEDKLDVLRLSYEDSSAMSLGVRTDGGDGLIENDDTQIIEKYDINTERDVFKKIDNDTVTEQCDKSQEDGFTKINTDELIEQYKIKEDILNKIGDDDEDHGDRMTKEYADRTESTSATVELSVDTSSGKDIISKDFDPELGVCRLSDSSSDEGISSPQMGDTTTEVIIEHHEPGMQLDDVQFEIKSKSTPDSTVDLAVTEQIPDQEIVQEIVEEQIIPSRKETSLTQFPDASLPLPSSDVVIQKESNLTECVEEIKSVLRKRDSSDEEDKGFVDVDLLQDKSAPQSPVKCEVKELTIEPVILTEKSHVSYSSISLKPEDFEYRSPTTQREIMTRSSLIVESSKPELALREDESVPLESAHDIPPVSTRKLDIYADDTVKAVLKDYFSDSPSLMEELGLTPPVSKTSTPAGEEFEVDSLDSEDGSAVRTGNYNVQGSLSSNESSRTSSPQPELCTEIATVNEITVTKQKGWVANSPEVTKKSSGGVSFDITQEDFEEMPLEPPKKERGPPKGGTSFYVNIDENAFHAVPAVATLDSREGSDSSIYKTSGKTDLSTLDG